jgi:hypothetical protein
MSRSETMTYQVTYRVTRNGKPLKWAESRKVIEFATKEEAEKFIADHRATFFDIRKPASSYAIV